MSEQEITPGEKKIFVDGKEFFQGNEINVFDKIDFIEIVKREDGAKIPIQQTISIPPDFFEKEKVTLKIKPFNPQLNIGQEIKIFFEMTGNPAALEIQYSTKGNDPHNFSIYKSPDLNRKEKYFTFRVPNIPSEECYIVLLALDEKNEDIAYNLSEKFTIKSPGSSESSGPSPPSPGALDIVLDNPTEKEGILLGGNTEFVWRIPNLPKDAGAELSISYGFERDKRFIPLGTKATYQMDSVVYTFPNTKPFSDAKELFFLLELRSERGNKTKIFGPFPLRKGIPEPPSQAGEDSEPNQRGIDIELINPKKGTIIKPGELLRIEWQIFNIPINFKDTLQVFEMWNQGRNTRISALFEDITRGKGFGNVEFPDNIPAGMQYGLRFHLKDANITKEFGPFLFDTEQSTEPLARQIPNAPQGKPEIILIEPRVGQPIIKGQFNSIIWKIKNPPKDFVPKGASVWQLFGNKRFPIYQNQMKGALQTSAPAGAEIDLLINVPSLELTKQFGPFEVADPASREEMGRDLQNIEKALNAIKEPIRKRGVLSMGMPKRINASSEGEVLYQMLVGRDYQKYTTAIRRVENYLARIKVDGLDERMKMLYARLRTQLLDTQSALGAAKWIIDAPEEMKHRVIKGLQNFVDQAEESIVERFDKDNNVHLKALNGEIIMHSQPYFEWVVGHADELDSELAYNIPFFRSAATDYKRNLEATYEQLERMKGTIKEINNIITSQ
ncbi:hypothetical protein HZA98_05330 [Candidatus Woesearchaeota archaeon]|nr:hypothetical protein [Candidatus Woesearchaeota archaeon]